MSGERRRLDRIESSLSPTQAVILWLEGAHQHGSLLAHARWLLDQPDDAYPLVKMPGQVAEAVRTAMKGRCREDILKEIRRAQKDVLFLFHLATGLNAWALERAETLGLKGQLLREQFQTLHLRRAVGGDMNDLRFRLCREFPYPLNPETAAAIEAAQKHGVETWDLLAEGEVLDEWVRQQYVSEGRIELPWGAHIPFVDPPSIPPPSFEVPAEEEIRALFPDEDSFQAFVGMEDYTNCLADVSDAAFDARAEALWAALTALVESGGVTAGKVLRLDTVPHEYLRDVPILEGEWVDRHVLVLAEYGALLMKRGYEVRHADDDHPFAWSRVFRDGHEMQPEETQALLTQAEMHLAKFPGEVSLIGGRPYLRLKEYAKWRSRWIKGRLDDEISDGPVRQAWNTWVDEHQSNGPPELAGVGVEKMVDYAADYPFQLVGDAAEARSRQSVRRQILGGLRGWTLSDPDAADFFWAGRGSFDRTPFREQVAAWCGQAKELLGELGEFSSACRLIERHYFAGHALLFPDAAEMHRNLLEATTGLVDLANEHFLVEWERFAGLRKQGDVDAEDGIRLERLDVDQMMEQADGKARAAYLVDMAKVEALEKLGERTQAEMIVERHLPATP
ncbi:MAG: hypothetical protein KKA32_05005 [Actinobacteria bacterium]|nr:hypothetical protein [Actinomycetota bacterium]